MSVSPCWASAPRPGAPRSAPWSPYYAQRTMLISPTWHSPWGLSVGPFCPPRGPGPSMQPGHSPGPTGASASWSLKLGTAWPHRSQATRAPYRRGPPHRRARGVPQPQHMPPRASARTVHHSRRTVPVDRPAAPRRQWTERHEAPEDVPASSWPAPSWGWGSPQKPHKRFQAQNDSGARGSRTVSR